MFDHILTTYQLSGAYPERDIPKESWLDQLGIALSGPVINWMQSRDSQTQEFMILLKTVGTEIEGLDDNEIKEKVAQAKSRLRIHQFNHMRDVATCFALTRELAHRTVGMRHFDVQIIGGLTILQGKIAEMETGEGKTLTATLPACAAALSGMPVHIITVNDYLAERDKDLMSPLYEAMGLSVGVIISGMSPEDRKQAYACDITYCTNKEIAFDYLKDRISLNTNRSRIRLQLEKLYGRSPRVEKLLMKGLYFAIIDEADSVLIDEARTPLVISGQSESDDASKIYTEALDLAKELNPEEDYYIETKERNIYLTEKGKYQLSQLTQSKGGIWTGIQRREEIAVKALMALCLFIKDKHYLVHDGKVQIIDEYTGRTMADRSWELGLHQLIEVKEGCEITGQRETIARITYQSFFRRYLHIAGMTGTAKEMSRELWSVYRLNVKQIPTNRPAQRFDNGVRIFLSQDEKWQAVIESVIEKHEQGRPVLVGTRSVETSEVVGKLLAEKGVTHSILNARQDADEAEIVAKAGVSGTVTVATNMAGRGTDIKLLDEVVEKGGLHVIVTEMNESKRIDRQLIGRCGRQGQTGSYEMIIAIDDELFDTYTNKMFKTMMENLVAMDNRWARRTLMLILRSAQLLAQRYHSQIRKRLLKMEDQLNSALAFSGKQE